MRDVGVEVPGFVAPSRIERGEVRDHLVQWHVVVRAPFGDVLHVPVSGFVERVVDRVLPTVEFQRQQPELVAQFNVERRGGFHPPAAEVDLGVAVPDEHVGAHGLPHPLGRQVVAYVGET